MLKRFLIISIASQIFLLNIILRFGYDTCRSRSVYDGRFLHDGLRPRNLLDDQVASTFAIPLDEFQLNDLTNEGGWDNVVLLFENLLFHTRYFAEFAKDDSVWLFKYSALLAKVPTPAFVAIFQNLLVQNKKLLGLLQLVERCLTATYFLFKRKFYQQTSGLGLVSCCNNFHRNLRDNDIGVSL